MATTARPTPDHTLIASARCLDAQPEPDRAGDRRTPTAAITSGGLPAQPKSGLAEGRPGSCGPLVSAAEAFREILHRLIEPGGLTSENLRAASSWLEGPAWELVARNDQLLAPYRRRAGQ